MLNRRLLVVLLLPIALVACGDDDGGARGDAYRAAFAETTRESDFQADAEEATCLGAAVVDVVGVDDLEKATTPEEIRKDPDAELDDLGIDLDDDQADELADKTLDCIEGTVLLERLVSSDTDTQLDDDVRSCLDDAYDDDVFHDLLAATFKEGDDFASEKRFATFLTEVSACAGDESGAAAFVAELATQFRNGTDLTEGEATCIAQKVVASLGGDRMNDLASGRQLSTAEQREIDRVVKASATACDVEPSRLAT
jgi:hypothetical protein